MSMRPLMPDIKCMDPDNYRKYFRTLCWNSLRKSDKRPPRKFSRKDKIKRLKAINVLAVCHAPRILPNPSHFAVYATVRKFILTRWQYVDEYPYDHSDDSDEEYSPHQPVLKVPKITGIGLCAVFTLISEARFTNSHFCEYALRALLDVLQGHSPEELAQEPPEMIASLQSMLVEIACGNGPGGRMELPSSLTALSSSCLMALSVARGEAELILSSVASLIMAAPDLAEQSVNIPYNLTTLQRSVQSVILGSPSRNQWLHYGVPHQSLATSFPVDLPAQVTAGSADLVVRSLVSDGCFLYVYTSRGLLKIGSGYGSSIKQHVYLYKPDFFASDRHGWLGFCKNKLYVRIGRKKPEVYEVDKETLEVRTMVRLDPGSQGATDHKSAVFTDGKRLGLVLLSNIDMLTIKMYDVDTPNERPESGIQTVTSRKDFNVHLLRRRTLAMGKAPYEDGLSRRVTDLDAPVAMEFDDTDDDPLTGIATGQDFGLLSTRSGRVYYTGKGTSLGYKVTAAHTGRWTLMKETLFNRHDPSNPKKCRVTQVAVGHEGVHAILVLDNGTAWFTGVARRGEDGDTNKHRRSPKPTRPRKILKAEGHHIVYAACNYGSTALVTRQGLVLMFGKDTQHCDANGLVTGLRHERIIQIALGKAHAVALTNFGQVYTFGINNKGQCGREFGYTKERPYPPNKRPRMFRDDIELCTVHTWYLDFCRVCSICKECTGFFSACHCARQADRIPGERCGCGEGDTGCTVCGVCRRCAELYAPPPPERADSDEEANLRAEASAHAGEGASGQYEGHSGSGSGSGSDSDKDSSVKLSCLPPARIAIPGGNRIVAVACGLHHTVLLVNGGDVLTFGSNQYGALGAGDVSVHHRIVRVRVPRVSCVFAGSNHTVLLTRDGEVYTFGAYQKGALGRPRIDEPRSDRGPIWYATPGRVPNIGPRYANQAVWITASGDQTFVQVSQTIIKTDTIFSATITANSNSILVLPNRPEHTFKCITINKADGSCNAWTGSEQVDFVNTLACLDPLYDVLWCYQPGMRLMKCYNILAFDSHKLQRCCFNDPDSYAPDSDFDYPNYGIMRRLEDFKNLENFEFVCNSDQKHSENIAVSNMSILNQELAIPSAQGCSVTRMHAALHLLGCLDSLTYAHDARLSTVECKRENQTSPILPAMEDYLTVNRFESHGGGWGYSGHSVEAIRFMCDNDILLGGLGLFGGRGDYAARIKLFDIGPEGGEQESDGDLLAETDEITYECPPRDKFPVLFENPIPLAASRWYVAWACINGPSSDCGSSGQAMVINDDVGFHFKTSKKSNNGTDVNAGQIPCLLYNVITSDHMVPVRHVDFGEPIIILSKNISRKVTVHCFRSLINLLQWSWNIFKEIVLDTNGQVPINYNKLTTMKHQKRLVYVIRACIRLVKSYTNEVYPKNNRRRNSHDYMPYLDIIGEARNFIQGIMADPTPTCSMLPRKAGRNKSHRVCYVQFALEMTNSILNEAHETVVSCFHAFYPNPALKWNYLCSLLYHVKDGVVPPSHIRALTSTCAAMCDSRSLCEVLQYIVPITQSSTANDKQRPDSRVMKDVPSRSATVPRSSHSQKPPPIPPRTNRDNNKPQENAEPRASHEEWHLMDAVPRLLDVVVIPIKQQMMTRQCGQPHDHGEIRQRDRLTEYCCKLTARIVGDLTYNASNEDMGPNTVRHLITPSRFMRVNQSRVWNTGNGTPDAICFSVDRIGIALVGACIYGGTGTYDYTLELLHDVRLKAPSDETNPSHCWVSVETVHGTFTGTDLQHDMVQIKFERPILLKEELRYALRLCNQGARTASGDCGLPSVNGPDGTTFTFTSCSLSFNGTSLARGQIPCLIYQGSSKSLTGSESGDRLYSIYRGIALRVAGAIMARGAELFATLRHELTAEDLRRNAFVLQQSPVINTLLPYTLANLDELDDPMSAVRMLEMIHQLLPHVAAMNLLVPPIEDVTTNTTSHFYTWVESEHPYKQAIVSNMRVLFPPQVSWIVLEMDPRSLTAQPEDSLTVYAVAGAPKHKCHCTNEIRMADPPFRKVYKRLVHLTSETGEAEELEDANTDAPCTHYNCTYVSVTPRLSNVHNAWPKQAMMVPGNEVIFSLETASDYLNEYNKPNNDESRFGFRCLCVGYEDAPFTSQKQGLTMLEMELVYAGASSASRLLAPDIEIPPLQFSTIMELQMSAAGVNGGGEAEAGEESDALLLARGLELSSPPSVHHVIDGLPLMRSASTERKFLSDFVAGAESTAGGRLACWLAPAPRVLPTNCEMKPPASPVRPATKVTLPVIVKDQYGDVVTSPALKVEVVVQRLGEQRAARASCSERRGSVPDAAYNPVVRDTMTFKAITMMKAYQNFSFEELRLASGVWGSGAAAGAIAGTGRVPAERISVQLQPDGTYLATWTPRAPGSYEFRCSLDNVSSKQELTIDVVESPSEEQPNRSQGTVAPVLPSRVKIYLAPDAVALRVRASPSLQAEEIGRVPPGANIAFVEEVVNKDGTWVRLSAASITAYACGAPVAWCMQYHRPYDRILLQSIDQSPADETEGPSNGVALTTEQPSWNTHEEEDGAFAPSDLKHDGRRFPFTIRTDSEEAGDSSSGPFMFGIEPSKRGRLARYESTSAPSPRRAPRRSNGNADDWWSPVRYRSSDNLRDASSMPEGELTDAELMLGGRLAQACTQTSPDTDETSPIPHFHIGPPREGKESRSGRERGRARFRRSVSPPPVPLRAPALPPRKYALSPAQAECLRAVFASMLRHEGIVADAIACAAFLKFHPHLPKSGAPVVTRGAHDLPAHKPQRHSVEVSNAGLYLRINASTLESLTRSGTEASASRARKSDLETAIREEEPHSSHSQPGPSTSSTSVVNVLPPALRALVALWDALCESDQLAPATDKFKREIEANENEEIRPISGVRRKKDSKYWSSSRSPYALFHIVRCELCGGANVAPPLAGHMKQAHPGCRAPTSRGYDRAGVYREADPPPDGPSAACGQLAQDLIGVKIRATLSAYQLWYIYCEKCRERSLKSTSSAKHKTITIIEGPERDEGVSQELDHLIIRDNALFLLDLAPLNSSEALSTSPWHEMSGRSPPTPPGSVWQPAPPFQVLPALGAAPRAAAAHAEPARYHSLGRPPPPPPPPHQNEEVVSRVHRSVSMGQAGARDLASAALMPLAKWEPDPIDTLPGAAGSSLLAQPSSALQKLVSCGEWTNESCPLSAFEPPTLDVEALMRSPVMSFVLARKDLHGYRQKMDAAVRINTVRQYGFEAMNWLLRSATQPTCVHDVMWWFCNTLDKYSRIMPAPAANDDNKENSVNEVNPRILQTPSASAICPGGGVARGSRAAFHAFLGSVSALAPSLPAASAAGLQAVRSWALHYSPHDRTFLHRSQVFSVISKILSHSEDGSYEEGMLGAIHESFHSFTTKQPTYVWSCPDMTGWCDVAVSSRQGMAGALTDGSTETFWESGDEDRNKAKWIQVSYPGGATEERPHVVCLHIDNTRDTVNKTLLVSFLFSGGTTELFHMQDLEVDTKAATWLCYTLPRMSSSTARVRCELRGPEAAVRVRQVRVLGCPALAPPPSAAPPLHALHALQERDTLRVFRLLTSQVFGKLLEWEESGSEVGEAVTQEEVVGDDTDLREHVVGILFAGHKLTSLQSQVMSHIVMAIGCEAARVRDDWETALLVAESAVPPEADDAPRPHHHTQDSYCFEMLSMLLALSGSVAGRAHLAQRTELLPDLLALLHTGSERVQRQVISLLRRIIIEIPPQKMLAALNFGNDMEIKVTLLDHLVCYLGKAMTVQVKVKGAGGSTSSGSITMGSSVTPAPPAAWFMRGDTLKQHSHVVSELLRDMAEDKMTPAWGAETRSGLAQYVAAIAQTPDGDRQPARCLAAPTVWMALAALCVCEQSHIDLINSASEARKCKIETASAASSVPGSAPSSPARRLSGMSEAAALPAPPVDGVSSSKTTISFECVAGPSNSTPMPGPSFVSQSRPTKRKPYRTITLAEVVVEKPSVINTPAMPQTGGAGEDSGDKTTNETSESEAGAVSMRRMCVNHDDGTTCAVIDCRTCGPLCTECDRFLHLSRVSKTHQRQICKEEESAIRVDIHEGCGRAKLFWLLLLVDRRTLKALAEFRGLEGGVCDTPGPTARAPLAGVCRYCGVRGNSGLLAIGNICADHQCQEHGRESCTRVLSCGHGCGGVRGERSCLPCLFGCGGGDALRQDADDMCMICFTDPLQGAPAIQLKCGHVFHLHCCKKVILNKWNGPRITFSFSQCPICKEDMSHWTLEELLAPIKRLKEEVRRKAMMRLEYEGLAASGSSRGRAVTDPATYAMERYAYYVCHKCGKAYFGGLARCEAETNGAWEPSELVCGACSDVAGARVCPKHGADFLEYKCRYCCSVAVFFCFGTSHFCNACHDDFQRVTNIPRHMLPQCPAGPKAEQLPGSSEECPLHVQHPPTGEEFALGCGVCRHAHAF